MKKFHKNNGDNLNNHNLNKNGIFKYVKLKENEVEKLINNLSNFYGDDLNFLKEYQFYKSNAEKVQIFNGDLENIDITRINTLGIYFGTFHRDRFRLSVEGSKFIKPKKNYVLLNENSFKSYVIAENLFLDEIEKINKIGDCPFLIVIYNKENLGSVSIKEKEILTYMPKSRKLDYNKIF